MQIESVVLPGMFVTCTNVLNDAGLVQSSRRGLNDSTVVVNQFLCVKTCVYVFILSERSKLWP